MINKPDRITPSQKMFGTKLKARQEYLTKKSTPLFFGIRNPM
ncbi:MAG: hypothetical protein ACD_75C00309G0003 [uncultured bacterium]|nr:MAG: hypothetical protein ACD_75C00309G0003 [uncultured bacterium]